MSSQATTILSDAVIAEIDKYIAKYPSERKQSAVMGALHAVQDDCNGSLTTELMDAVADYQIGRAHV